MSNYTPPEAEAQAIKDERLAEYRKAVYERELNIAVFDAKGETARVNQEQAEIDEIKVAIDALLALD